MWIVKLALDKPYTFIVLAVAILIAGVGAWIFTPADIFPNIDIPVISIAYSYTGLDPEAIDGRLTTPFERTLTTLVDNIEHIESTSYNGISTVKVYLQPGASVDTANAQVVAVTGLATRLLPPGIQPPEILNFSASSVPVIQLGLSGMSEQDLADLALNTIRTPLITVKGAVIPYPYGGKTRQIMISLDQNLMQAKGVSPTDVLDAVNAQNLVLPSGTVKIGADDYDVRLNTSPTTAEELGDIPIKQVGSTVIYVHDVATVSSSFAVQTNIVRQNGHRGVLISILKAGSASTLNVVSDIRKMLPRVQTLVPPQLKITPLADQSVFVRGGDRRRGARGGHRRVPDRDHDPGLPGQLAEHAHHRRLHPAFDPGLHRRAQRAARDDQHHDPGRPGAGGRHPGRRRHGDDREHRAAPGGRARSPRRAFSRVRRRSPCPPSSRPPASASSFCPCSCCRDCPATSSRRWRRRWSSP